MDREEFADYLDLQVALLKSQLVLKGALTDEASGCSWRNRIPCVSVTSVLAGFSCSAVSPASSRSGFLLLSHDGQTFKILAQEGADK
jgi:hypothetical protein